MVQGISIDGTVFNVPIVSIKRTADFLDKYAERTEDGDLKRELIGVYFNYQMNFGIIEDDALYSSLFNKLTEPVEYHDFTVPTTGGDYSFRGYIGSVSDEVLKVEKSTTKFQNLSCKFVSKKPSRIKG